MHASVAALRGRTECSSHRARTLVSTPGHLWEGRWPLLVVLGVPDPQTEYQAQIQVAKYDRYLRVFRSTTGQPRRGMLDYDASDGSLQTSYHIMLQSLSLLLHWQHLCLLMVSIIPSIPNLLGWSVFIDRSSNPVQLATSLSTSCQAFSNFNVVAGLIHRLLLGTWN